MIQSPLSSVVFSSKKILDVFANDLIPIVKASALQLLAATAEMQKAASMASMLVLFFSQTVLIFGLLTRSAYATADFLNISMHNLCNCAICGLCICTACPDSTVSASAIDTDGTRTLSQTQNA